MCGKREISAQSLLWLVESLMLKSNLDACFLFDKHHYPFWYIFWDWNISGAPGLMPGLCKINYSLSSMDTNRKHLRDLNIGKWSNENSGQKIKAVLFIWNDDIDVVIMDGKWIWLCDTQNALISSLNILVVCERTIHVFSYSCIFLALPLQYRLVLYQASTKLQHCVNI